MGGDPHEGTLKLTNVRADTMGDEFQNPWLKRNVEIVHLAAQDGDARLKVRGLNLGGQTPFKAGDQAVLQILHFTRRPVTREHDLLRIVEELVEGVEELFLRAVLALEKLHVINQQDIDLAVFLAELGEALLLDGLDILIGELLGGHVAYDGSLFARQYFLTDGLHEVGFTQACGAIKEEWIVNAARLFSDGAGDGG